MKTHMLLSTLLFLTACGGQVSPAKSDVKSEAGSAGSKGYRTLAEYEKMDSIILSFPLVEEAKSTKMRDEYSNMMKSFLDHSDARISFYTIFRQSSAERFYEYFPELLVYAARIDIRPVYDEHLNFTFDESEDDFGTWMRDASPVSGIDIATGKPILFDMQYGNDNEVPVADSLPLHFAKSTGLPLVKVPLIFEGGNFMSTTTGICSVSDGIYGPSNGGIPMEERDRILKEHMGCKDIIYLEPIPGAIEHSDMIAKFLDDKTVSVTRFESNEVYFPGTIANCSKNSEECMDEDWGRKAGLYDPHELSSWVKAEAARRTGLAAQEKWFGGEAYELLNHEPGTHELSELSNIWTKKFQDAGFKTVDLPTPAPEMRFEVKASGTSLSIYPELEYVTYANALIFGKKVFIPAYQYGERIEVGNKASLKAYSEAGFDAIPVPTKELTEGREGSLHCMSMNIRTK